MTINKITKSPTPTELIKKVNELVEGVNTGGSRTSSIPIGHVYTIGYSELDAGQLPLLGGEYSRTTYADLWAWVQSKSSLLKTESQWQALKTASGDKGVPYYSSGNGATTFRVPMFGCYIKCATNMGDVGGLLAAGLPNITGTIGASSFSAYDSGSFNYTSTTTSTLGSGSSPLWGKHTFDASNSSSIYGNSDTVQPASIIQLYVVQAFGEVTNVGSTDVAAIAVGLQEVETRTSALEADLTNFDFTIIYPNGGTDTTPANASINSRFINANPFAGHPVVCVAEVLYNGQWGSSGWCYSGGGYGISATHQQSSDNIITQSGSVSVLGRSTDLGNGFNITSTAAITQLPIRIKVWRCKG